MSVRISPDPLPLRSAYRVSVGVLVALLLASGICYLQRMLFVDPSFITLEVIVTDSIFIMEQRYGSFITHLAPLVGSRLGLSLDTILLVYSSSFYAFYLGVALVVGGVWKQYGLATLLALYFTLVVSDVFYWPNNEIHQAVAWMMLFLGRYFSRRGKPMPVYDHLLLLPVAFLAANTHLLLAAPLAFLWVYLNLFNAKSIRQVISLRTVAYTVVIAVAIGLRYWMSKGGGYDSAKLPEFYNLGPSDLLATFTSGQAKTMYRLVLKNYWVLIPLVLGGTYGALRSRKWWMLPIAAGAALGYFCLVCITYPSAYGREYLFYFESEWQAFGLILATPFVLHFLPRIPSRLTVTGLMVLIFGIRLAYITTSYSYFDTRLENLGVLNEAVREIGKEKALLVPASALAPYFGMSWGLPVETYFLSLLREPARPVTVKNAEAGVAGCGGHFFISAFRAIQADDLPPAYLPFSRDVEYQVLTEAEVSVIVSRLRPLPE